MDDRLDKFFALVNAGTYTATAKQLHTSQPALTVAMQKLARELGTALFIAGHRGIKLTAAGRLTYEHARQSVIARKNFQGRLHALAGTRQPLNLGCIDSIAELLVGHGLLGPLERKHEISLDVQSSGGLIGELSKGHIDLAVVVEQPFQPPATERRFLGNERFAVVCAAAVATRYLTAQSQGLLPNFLAYDKASTTYSLLAAQLTGNGVTCEARLYSSNPSILLRLALQGHGITALPVSLVRTYLGTRLVELRLKKPLYRPIIALWQTGYMLPAACEDFLAAAHLHVPA